MAVAATPGRPIFAHLPEVFALAHDQVYGIWGGTTPEDRQRERRRKRRAAAAAAKRTVAA